MQMKIKDIQFLHSKDSKQFFHILPTTKEKIFYVIVLHNEDLLDEQFIEQAKSYEPIMINDEPLVFVKGNEYSRDLRKFIEK